jgi:hypothetical protein
LAEPTQACRSPQGQEKERTKSWEKNRIKNESSSLSDHPTIKEAGVCGRPQLGMGDGLQCELGALSMGYFDGTSGTAHGAGRCVMASRTLGLRT